MACLMGGWDGLDRQEASICTIPKYNCTEYRVIKIILNIIYNYNVVFKPSYLHYFVIFHISNIFILLALSISTLSPGGVGDHRLELGVDLAVACAILRCHLTVL